METEQKAIKQSFDLQQQTLQNESAILACLRIYNSLNTELSSFETLLFDHAANIPRQLFKHFRKISELIETSFSTLEGYISFNPSYIEEKDKILQEQISLMEEQITKKKSTQFTESDGFKQKSGTKSSFEIFKKTQESNDPRQLEFLRQEIETLQNELRKNDSEYEIQIKKYNTKYQELQEEIDYYKDEMSKLGEYAEAVEKLEIQLRIMKEMRDRDECLIQNMARKLRNAEREKSHNFAFVSPSKQNFLSPSRMSYNLQPKNYFSSKYE